MRRRRHGRRAGAGAGLAFLLVVLGGPPACSTFEESPGTPAEEAGAPDVDPGDAGGDAVFADSDTETDGATSEDAGGACGDEVLLGNANANSNATDGLGPDSVDAYGYLALKVGTARCFHFFLAAPRKNAVNVGVYESTNNTAPSSKLPTTLIAQSTIDAPKVGWNVVRLNRSLDITPATTLWLAVSPLPESGKGLTIQVTKSGTCAQTSYLRGADTKDGVLVAEFTSPRDYADFCEMAAYLSP